MNVLHKTHTYHVQCVFTGVCGTSPLNVHIKAVKSLGELQRVGRTVVPGLQ